MAYCHYHAFSGRGGYAFPLHDRRPNINAPNIRARLIENLSAAYGSSINAQEVFDAILCLLSAQSYTRRFAEDLEDVFPHVPFPARSATFREAVRLGREIRRVEAFSREPEAAYRRPAFARVTTPPRDILAPAEYADGMIALCRDGSGRITGLPQDV
jgi:hypothetical protein